MIKPTPGRIVWYRLFRGQAFEPEPLAAIVVKVHSDRRINVTLFLPDGTTAARTDVMMLQPGDKVPRKSHCEWMPYQLGQAKAAEVPKHSHTMIYAEEAAHEDDGRGSENPPHVAG